MTTERFTFRGHNGDDLSARLDLPDGPHLATALFAHCFTCGKDIPAARRIAAQLAAQGIAVLRFDFTGLGHSKGEFANTSFTSNVGDLQAAMTALEARGMPATLLIGHSLGGAAVLKAAASAPQIRAVVTLGAPSDPGHVLHNFEDALGEIAAHGSAEVHLGGRPIRIGQGFVEDARSGTLTDSIHRLGAALLVLHAPRDEIVSIDNASDIFIPAKHPKSFVTLDDADHLISRPEDAEYAAQVIRAWVARYIDLTPPPVPRDIPEGVLRVSEADPDGFLQDISDSGGHQLVADEPKAVGGTDHGVSPYGLLSAGLGACTSMTIRMYARRKGWPLDHVSVDVSHNKAHAMDAHADAAAADAKIDRFHRVIHLTGALDDAQRMRLLDIADRCPVHRTLERTSQIETTLAAD